MATWVLPIQKEKILETNLVPVSGDPLSFLFAGNCIFTIANHGTGNHFTYLVQAPETQREPNRSAHFVKVLTGPDNTKDYSLLGTVFSRSEYRHSYKSAINPKAPSEVVFVWLLARLLNGGLPNEVQIYHHGRCGRCGRVLTVPSSIETGLGPECAARLGGL